MNFFLKKRFNILITALLILFAVLTTLSIQDKYELIMSSPQTSQEAYDLALHDALTIESEEILPLVVISSDSPMVTWNDEGQVLLLSWHKYPDSYTNGSEISLQYGEVWTFTDKEIKAWYKKNASSVKDWNLRLKQLIGLPENSAYTHVSAFWVAPEDILRPAYNYDISQNSMYSNFQQENIDPNFKEWFDKNIIWSYFDAQYPWTRLGYTYDWANNGIEYGLTEFIIKKDSAVKVEFTKTNEEFLAWLAQNN